MNPFSPEMEQLKLRIEVLEEEKGNLENRLQSQTIELKYALFDAEASKREKHYYKKLLDEKNK
jgi:hypothetical protein